MGNLFSETTDYFYTVAVEVSYGFIHDKIRNFEILMVVMYYINVYYNFKGKLRRHSENISFNSNPPRHKQSNLFSEP